MAAKSSDRDSSKDSAQAELSANVGESAADSTAPNTDDELSTAAAGMAETPRSADAPDSPAPGGSAADAESGGDSSSKVDVANSAEETESAESTSAASPATDTDESRSPAESRGYPPALIATAVALPVVLVVAVLVAAILARRAPTEREPLVLGPVPAPAASGPACTALLPALPVDLGDYTKSTLVEPAPPATRAWQRQDGGDAIVLRCGLDRPLEFNRAAALQIVNGVQWFEVRDPAAKASTWFAVDRETYIALTVPDGSGPTPLQGVSDTITANLPAQPIDPGPLPN
jgi:hypothetical protein